MLDKILKKFIALQIGERIKRLPVVLNVSELAGAHPKELQLHLRHASLEETDKYIRQLGFGDFSTIETSIRRI